MVLFVMGVCDSIVARFCIPTYYHVLHFINPILHFRNMDIDHLTRILDNDRISTNVNTVNAHGRTPLHIAAIMDNQECVERLVNYRKKGILRFVLPKNLPESEMTQLNLKDNNGDTPLLLAVKNDSAQAANVILAKLKCTSINSMLEWHVIWSHCLSTKMRQVLKKYYHESLQLEMEDANEICNNISIGPTCLYLKPSVGAKSSRRHI